MDGQQLDNITEVEIRNIRQTLMQTSGSYVSNELWESIARAFQVVVSAQVDVMAAIEDFQLYTFSPDETVCSMVWPYQADENQFTLDVFVELDTKERIVYSEESIQVNIFFEKHLLMVCVFSRSLDVDGCHASLDWLAAEIGTALFQRRTALAGEYAKSLREHLSLGDSKDRTRILLEVFADLLFRDDAEARNGANGELHGITESRSGEQQLLLLAELDGRTNPYRSPASNTLVKQVLANKRPGIMFERTSEYADIESHIKSCIKLPVITWDGNVIGIFCVHLPYPFCFNLGLVHVAELLISQCAAVEVDRARQPDALTRRAEELRRWIPTYEELRQKIDENGPLADARRVLYQSLSEMAFQMANATRSAVALVGVDLDRRVSVAGAFGNWPENFAGVNIAYDEEDSGVIRSLRESRPEIVEDTTAPGACYMRVDGEQLQEIGSAAYIPLIAGANRLGVLAVEWTDKGQCDELLERYLLELCNIYALVLNSFGIERQLVKLDDLLKSCRSDLDKPLNYEGIMRLTAEMFGISEGAILIRGEDGRLYFEANLQYPNYVEDQEAYYESDGADGSLTGSIANNNEPVRTILNQSAPETVTEPWKNLHPDNSYKGGAISFVGAPISSGDEVYGVIRLNADASIREFDSIDETTLSTVARRIADCLEHRAASRRSRAKIRAHAYFSPRHVKRM